MRSWMSFLRWAAPKVGSGLADEVEAFLGGRYLERLRSRGESGQVAPWMWINAVAHGSASRVAELAADPVPEEMEALDWRVARAFVARELVGQNVGEERLRSLQRDVLIPLELRLMSARDLTPAWLVTATLAELAEHDL
ncbi:MAG: hypothetical protein ACRDV1_00130 [Actinomycetes bacterium]